MKRYLIFSAYKYYPSGGWGDFRGSCDDLSQAETQAKELMQKKDHDWYEIVDITSSLVVKSFDGAY